MRFSIAIPAYNQANYLPSALESIRVQNQDVQLAVMDATPDDCVQQVLESYRDLLNYHRHGKDAGQTSAIQEGWDNTDGEIVAWLCADDYYFPNTLELVSDIFAKHPEIDVVYGDAVFVNEADHFIGYFPEVSADISSILKGCTIAQPSCFVRRSAFNSIGKLNVKLHYTMDWDLWIRLYKSGAKFHYLSRPLSVVRMYQGTKTSSHSWGRFYEIGRHLRLNTNALTTARSLLGFYSYSISTSSHSTIFERAFLKTLNIYGNHKSRIQRLMGVVNRRVMYGLSLYGNEVEVSANIFLPWYKKDIPAIIRVNSDLENKPEVYLNGFQLSVIEGASFCYAIPAIDLSSHLLHLQISSSSVNIKWRLHSVELF